MNTKPLNKVAIQDVMRLAKKNATSASADTNNNNSDDDIISPRIREFMKTLNENDIQLIDADEEAQKLIFKLKADSSTDKEIASISIIAQIVGDDIVYYFTYHGHIYSYLSAYIEHTTDYGNIAFQTNNYTHYIDHALESLRERSLERQKEHSR